MKVMCAAGINNIYYINDYRNDELVEYFSKISQVPVEKIRPTTLKVFSHKNL